MTLSVVQWEREASRGDVKSACTSRQVCNESWKLECAIDSWSKNWSIDDSVLSDSG